MNDNHAMMHQEHRKWAAENSQWRDDLRVWEQQTAAAQVEAQKLSAELEAVASMLRKHAAALRITEQDSAEHERALVEFERSGATARLAALGETHTTERERQARLRANHAQLKDKVHELFAGWHAFLARLQAALPARSAMAAD